MRQKFLKIMVFGLAASFMACGSTAQVIKRIDMLEKEAADLHRANRKIDRRLDELQIQMSLLLKKVVLNSPRTKLEGSLRKSPKIPNLKVVKLRPAESSPKLLKIKKLSRLAVQSVPVAVEPDEVTERLPVDPRLEKIPILGGLIVEPEQVRIQAEEDDGYDEESIAIELQAAIAYFRKSDFTRVVKELRRFVQKYPEHFLVADALYYLGHARFAQGYYKDAEVDFSAVSLQHPECKFAAGAMLMAAQCHEKLGRRKNARSVYLQLVQAYPLSEEAAEANRRLQSIQ
ncbi:MAG: tetratricopeptide repeat protein [Deltaproteobacteria bacterium]|nr:tetratricopeptide repeat protein [Deltaproteobacteria bacterium]MBW1872004.1 tetratricopeptide repeat protein [Deltaproteobacteria bacterium]